MSLPKISVIVPVYNAEKFLHRCVDSILSQSFTDFELLLIDDGSKDCSGEICDEYAAKDTRVRVFHKPNGGVSSARNMGLDNAQGEWIAFVDADDYWFKHECLEKLHNVAIINNVDVVRGEYKEIDDFGNVIGIRPNNNEQNKYINCVVGPYEFLEYNLHGEFFLWLMLIKRNVIGDLRFQVDQIYLEDMKVLIEILIKNNCCCMYVPDICFYAYRKHKLSATFHVSLRMLKDAFQMCGYCDRYESSTKDERMKYYFASYKIRMYYETLKYFSRYYYHDRFAIIDEMNLKEIQKVNCHYLFRYRLYNKFSIVAVLPPLKGILLLRLGIKIKEMMRDIRFNK